MSLCQIQIESDANRATKRRLRLNSFKPDLRSLLTQAGCFGLFIVYDTEDGVPGSSQTKGITLGQPVTNGVEIYSQYGDNGSRRRWILFPPPDSDPSTLHRALHNVLHPERSPDFPINGTVLAPQAPSPTFEKITELEAQAAGCENYAHELSLLDAERTTLQQQLAELDEQRKPLVVAYERAHTAHKKLAEILRLLS